MSRKPYFLMSRQGQLKRLKMEMSQMAQTHANISTNDNHSEENISFSDQEMMPPIEENEFDNIDQGSFPRHSNSPPIQPSTASSENYSVYHNLLEEHPLSDSDHENQVNPVDINDSFINNLRHWALKYQVTHVAINALLNILKNHNCFDLPADARSLLKTPENVITRIVEPGHYSHIGLEKNLRKIWEFVTENESEINLLINIDGVPLFKSSSMEFWPILGLVSNIPSIKSVVFPIGVYCGTKKPSSCTSFMEEFVSEIVNLISSGLTISGKNIKVAIKGFVCDTPAKSFLLGVKGHTGYYSCTKCKQPGVYLQNRMTFPECDASLRTHEEFIQMADEDFQHIQTPLTAIPGIHFIKSFPLDYMHLVCLGVVRTLIYLWMFGPVPLKLPRLILNNISTDLVALAKHMPLEFNRKPRSLDEVKRWKATEFRQFLLYTGPLVLLKLRSEYLSYYENFLSLTVSMSILLNPEYCFEYNDYARNLLKHFVKTFINIYGSQMATYNLHGLIHLSDDVFEFGALDSCSAFPFENFLQVFKKNIRKGDKPLQQIIKRYYTMANFVIVKFVDEDDAPGIIASNWIVNDCSCYYPNVRTEELKDKLLKKKAEPEPGDTWTQYKIKILKYYETYAEARIHLKKAEETSNLDSDEEVRKRKRKIRNVYLPEDFGENSGDEFPTLKMTKTQPLKKKEINLSKYPIPPKPKPIAKLNTLVDQAGAEKIKKSSNTTESNCPLIIVPAGDYTYVEADIAEVSSDMAEDADLARNYCSNETVDFPLVPEVIDADIAEFANNGPIQRNLTVNNPNVTTSSSPTHKRDVTNCVMGCPISKQFGIQQTHLIQVVTDLAKQMVDLNRKVDLLLGKHAADACIVPTEENLAISELLASLPVKDDASFCHFNEQLEISRNKQAVMSFLAGIGGRNIRSLTTNILRRILQDEVAELYSLTGKQMKNSNKKTFLKTETCKIIFQICKKVFEDATENNLKEIISDWLNQAKVRTTRRKTKQ
ncbi:uncharacterized protein isoform X2 [Choristoneura fumiferana]|uniref:uncharacterized protein isoform X2 n=1 Tax=Choristoneura fumiferana TaxID=7141 RepID=UPI003D158713